VWAEQLRKPQVLLVDDDASIRRALERTIRLAGFDVEAFASAESLLARGVCERDACLVLDIDLPGVDGIACKRQLDAFGRQLPTVFITALTAAEVREPLSEIARVAVLHKPFNKHDLLDAIGRACGPRG
jgi:FixJ family two-component response regulator